MIAKVLDHLAVVSCLLGFIIGPACFQAGIITNQSASIVRHPQRTNATTGSSVTLDCKFSKPVQCSWEFNSTTFRSGQTAKFNDQSETDNCSLVIASMSLQDVGTYICQSLSSSMHETIRSESAWLGQLEESRRVVQIVEHPKSQVIWMGSTIHLRCLFDLPTDCVWRRRGRRILVRNEVTSHPLISSRYDMGTSNGKNSIDCTLKISGVEAIDIGPWRCTGLANSTHHCPTSNSAWIADKDNHSSIWIGCGVAVIATICLISTICFFKWISHLQQYPQSERSSLNQ